MADGQPCCRIVRPGTGRGGEYYRRQPTRGGLVIPEINYWAVLLATLGSMIVGSLWYAPKTFGRRWAKLAGVDLDDPQLTAAQAWMPLILGALMSFVTAWALAGASAIAWHF